MHKRVLRRFRENVAEIEMVVEVGAGGARDDVGNAEANIVPDQWQTHEPPIQKHCGENSTFCFRLALALDPTTLQIVWEARS